MRSRLLFSTATSTSLSVTARTDKRFQSLQVRGTSVTRRAGTPLFNKLTAKFKIVLIKNKINYKNYNYNYNI
jgi:hypothetical protein